MEKLRFKSGYFPNSNAGDVANQPLVSIDCSLSLLGHFIGFCRFFTLQMETEALVIYSRGWQTFSVKGQIAMILGFVHHVISVLTTHLCRCGLKSDVDDP